MLGQLLQMWDSSNIAHEDQMYQVETKDWVPGDHVVGWLQQER
jgi:hypothetical protein